LLNVTKVEQTLLLVLREFLDDIGPEDNFYVSGGDSIIALRVVAAAKDRGLEVGLRDLLLQPTVGELALAIAQGADPPGRAESPPELKGGELEGLPRGAVDAFPATALASGLIYLCERADDPSLYHDFIGMRVVADFDESAFRSALRSVLRRHPMLRSSFDLASYDFAAQLIWPEIGEPLTVELAASEEDAEERASRWIARRLHEGIDWTSPPLLSCYVAAAPGSFLLTIGIHHAIIDGWSFARLIVEVLTCYDANLGGEPAPLPPVPASGHREFRALEREALNSADSARFWQGEADCPPLLLKRPRFGSAADPTASRALRIEDRRIADLRRAAAVAGVPLKSLLLAVHGLALGRWTNRDRDVVTGLVVNGRPEIEGSDLLIDLFLNTVPLRLRSATGPFADLAKQALAAEQSVIPHRRYPLARIEDTLKRPAFDVTFNFTHFHVYKELADLRRVKVDRWRSYDKASFPLMVDFVVDAPAFGTGIQVAFDETVLAAERIDGLIGFLDEGLDQAARVN
jgi:aryl carrier-like protein